MIGRAECKAPNTQPMWYLVEVEVPCCLTGVGNISRDVQALLQAAHFFQELQSSGQDVVDSSVSEGRQTDRQTKAK